MSLSKSKYVSCCQCGKKFWLELNHPELAVADPSVEARFKAGTEIGDMARALFGPYTDVTVTTTFKGKDGNDVTVPDKTAMVKRTAEEMTKGTGVICEAAFMYDDCYCAVDILCKSGDGYALYEVKSSTEAKDVYDQDISYQKWVLEKCGVKVTSVNLVVINNKYVYDGVKIDINELFEVIDRSEAVEDLYAGVPNRIKAAKAVAAASGEPDIKRGGHCAKPYACPFYAYCTRNLPKPGPLDLYRMSNERAEQLIADGYDTFLKLQTAPKLNKNQRLQINSCLKGVAHIDKEGLRMFLKTLTYPVYHLDFESIQLPVPIYKGTHPYQQVPTQFSIHVEYADGRLEHKEFLADAKGNPMREVAEALCAAIPADVCVTAYNDPFEKGRIKEMAEAFPDLRDHLMSIHSHIIDLLDPFRSFYYYLPAMGKSFSIKSVLPSLYPDDPDLNYHNLKGDVHNGGEAMAIFPKMLDMTDEEIAKTRKDLLEYCYLDTYAMVCVLRKIREAAK